ncbi:hypothetical protein EYF80_022341 [Liparis tanakae]|uniref:Uncharacterized protein n=1 Tax=Liparis tanakae TaxID=230148 RepID=A0A4Z2HNF8_9TELE|nr:hypothetical protein EYF80_022341 [Liparis tanakae]
MLLALRNWYQGKSHCRERCQRQTLYRSRIGQAVRKLQGQAGHFLKPWRRKEEGGGGGGGGGGGRKQDSRGNGRDVRCQMQGCIAVDVHEVRLGMILQQYAHAALMLALHCLI